MDWFVAALEKRLGAPLPPSSKAAYLSNDPLALLASIRAFRGAISPKPEEVLPGIVLPLLLIVGEADPRSSTVRECAMRIPGSKFVSLPALDHVTAFTRIDTLLPYVRSYLAEAGLHQGKS